MVKSSSERHQVRAICDVCDSRGWGGYVGTFEYSPDESWAWWLVVPKGNGDNEFDRPTQDGGMHFYFEAPLRLSCSSGHRLRALDNEAVMKFLEGGHDKVRLLAG